MEKEEKANEKVAPSNRERFNSYMSERIEGYDPEDEEGSYGKVMDNLSAMDAEKQKLADAITADPRIAQLLSDIVSGKRSAAGALARYFGKDFLSAEEGSTEYDEIMAAEEERKKEAEEIAENGRRYKENIDNSTPVIKKFCEDNGLDSDDFLDAVYEKMIHPIMQGVYTEELLTMLHNALNYDKDIKDAMDAGEVKGRNTNINKMRSDNIGDGMPVGMGSEKTSPETRPSRKRTIFDDALGR